MKNALPTDVPQTTPLPPSSAAAAGPGIAVPLTLGHIAMPIALLLSLTPYVSSATALVLGAVLAVTVGNPYIDHTRRFTPRLLSSAVVGLGAGMNLMIVARVGAQGVLYTLLGISTTLALGAWLGRALRVERATATLIAVGTAICGGSAIAAVAPVIRAKSHEVSVALGTVFLLNALALVIFPPIGHLLQLSETQFGLWSALAIHDTSSVVGATLQYGPHAMQIGTTVKLARALWIVPVTLLTAHFYTHAPTDATPIKAKRPWFILGFVAAAALVTWVPALAAPGQMVADAAKRLLVVTLFLIGTGLTRATLRNVGLRPFLQGVGLWLTAASVTLGAVLAGWIG